LRREINRAVNVDNRFFNVNFFEFFLNEYFFLRFFFRPAFLLIRGYSWYVFSGASVNGGIKLDGAAGKQQTPYGA
jgi:hypothetical protein